MFLNKNSHTTSLKGLILVGGKSSRMGTDKSTLEYHGKTQKKQTFNLLNAVMDSDAIFYSVSKKQTLNFQQGIVDEIENLGPIGALDAAFKHDKNVAWLSIAIDLPFITETLLKRLIENRNPLKIATTFKGKNKDFPEPLITIWEPKAYEIIQQKIKENNLSLVKILQENSIEIIEIEDEMIQNINTFNAYQHIKNLKP